MFGSRLLRTHFSPRNTNPASDSTRGRPPISGLLIDISGNLHVDRTPTPGAIQAFQKLVEAGIPIRLCSNTSKESTANLVAKLDQLGFGVSEAQKALSRNASEGVSAQLVWTSIGAVADVLKNLGSKNPYLLLSNSARSEVLSRLNLDSASNEGKDFDSVVVGFAPSLFDYEHLNMAFRILKGESPSSPFQSTSFQPPLIATHRAKYIQASDEKLSLGPGPFVTALEAASGSDVEARVVGKPEAAFFNMVIKNFGDPPADQSCMKRNSSPHQKPRIAVIGDDIEADLGEGAVTLGLWRVLVKTGKYRQGDETRDNTVPPDEIHESFAAFVESFLHEA
ncbi:HAD-like domain-containing protein [Crepidotus variabilis]|uniref:HAD-like domain-containing protein n=1 Tax=Crepidotus variabilis TaxID=179855 RepID=A0A9P6EDR2_9AGAR|nr:HAD-like domain-containing protein [Crepidotus variabilis]